MRYRYDVSGKDPHDIESFRATLSTFQQGKIIVMVQRCSHCHNFLADLSPKLTPSLFNIT